MKIKGKEIVIIDNRENEPWPREISIDGEHMIFNNAWENTPSGQRIYYKAPDDKSAFQGVGVLRRDLLRVLDAGKQKGGDNLKTYHIKPEFLEAWGNETTLETVIDERELDRLAAEWGLEKAALLEQLDELED